MATPSEQQQTALTCYNAATFVRRPGTGRAGRSTQVDTNTFRVTSLPSSNLVQYAVTIEPTVPVPLNRAIFQQFETLNADSWNGLRMVYDGREIAYSPRPMPFGDDTRQEVSTT